MIDPADRRYQITDGDRAAVVPSGCYARDLRTGGQVFIKAGPPGRILHEYSVLLQLPAGISAPALDLVALDGQRLGLVEERLAGRTWLEAGASVLRDDLPRLVLDVCDRLAALHRLGFSHTDLKPANLFLLADPAAETRLLDLGSARSTALLELTEDSDRATAVTAPFAAPELLRGWATDTRVDQYSLGMILRWLRAGTPTDAAWDEIVDRLTQVSPSRRFADLTEVREEVRRRFGSTSPATRVPAFGAGPLRGRESDLAEIVRWAKEPGAPPLLVVHAQPGTGLTRFLRGSLAAVFAADGPPLRIVEITSDEGDGGGASIAAVDLAEGYARDGERVVLGVPDPGPALSRMCGPGADRLRRFLERTRVARLFLRPVSAAALQDMVATSLGAGGAATDALGVALHAQTEGDLRAAAGGFAQAASRAGTESGIRWILDEPLAIAAVEAWSSPERAPRVADLPEPLREPLRILARAGLAVAGDLARRLLDRFGHPDALDPLRGIGAVYDLEGGRIRFLHRQLRDEARTQALPQGDRVDRWLCAHADPDPRDLTHVLEAAARARALGDQAVERDCLGRALHLAVVEVRWSDVRLILEYPSGNCTEANAAQRAGDLYQLLGPAWPAARLLRLMGSSLSLQGHPLGPVLLNLVAQAPKTADGYESLFGLATSHATAGRLEEFAGVLQRMEAACGTDAEPVPGLAAMAWAHWYTLQGKRREAREQAERAAGRLKGSGLPQESEMYAFAAVACMPDCPGEAIDWLHRGLADVQIPLQRSVFHRLLASFHEFQGEPVEFAHNAQAALDDLREDEYPRHRVFLRTQRAWAWAQLDRVREARAEAIDLLQSPILQRDPQRMLFTTMLTGYTALQLGHGRTAIAQLAAAWEALDAALPPGRRAPVLRYFLDALLDLRAWSVLRENAESLTLPPGSPEAAAALTSARARALQVQAAGSDSEARAILGDLSEVARAHTGTLDSARFLHHQAEAALTIDPEAAAALFREAGDRLGPAGYGYFRARSLLGLARARARIRPADANRSLEETIRLARRIDARGVLADALSLRAEWGLLQS